jgi:TolB protein
MRLSTAACSAGLVFLSGWTMAAGPGPASVTPELAGAQGTIQPGAVAFVSNRDGNNEIYLMDPDGSNPTRLTTEARADADPDISPNGQYVIFTSNRGGNNDIFLQGLDGSVWNLTGYPGNDGWARFSPNGQQIVFHSNRDGNFEIYVMNADGSEPTRLTDYAGIDVLPDWSPDGQSIVFRRDLDIYTLSLRTGEVRRLTDADGLDQMAAWSPDGRYLAFMSFREGYCSVFRMRPDGSEQINLTPKDDGDLEAQWCSRAPSWTRTGQVLFMSFRPSTGGNTDIFMMDADGSRLRRLTDDPGIDGIPRAR